MRRAAHSRSAVRRVVPTAGTVGRQRLNADREFRDLAPRGGAASPSRLVRRRQRERSRARDRHQARGETNAGTSGGQELDSAAWPNGLGGPDYAQPSVGRRVRSRVSRPPPASGASSSDVGPAAPGSADGPGPSAPGWRNGRADVLGSVQPRYDGPKARTTSGAATVHGPAADPAGAFGAGVVRHRACVSAVAFAGPYVTVDPAGASPKPEAGGSPGTALHTPPGELLHLLAAQVARSVT